jgi:hypothetical protein
MRASRDGRAGITRRGFLLGAGTGLAAGVPLAWLGMKGLKWHGLPGLPFAAGPAPEVKQPEYGMPGPYPGRVVEVYHPDSVGADNTIHQQTVKAMIDRGMCQLTGLDNSTDAWKQFFKPGEVVGIKVNPVGRKRGASDVGSISSPEVLVEIVDRLTECARIRPQDIIVFERYASEFREGGYDRIVERDLPGVRWYASGSGYDDHQLDIEGYDTFGRRQGRDPHVAGYDPDVFVHMGFAMPNAELQKDSRRFRSHLSVIVTRMVDKFITIPVLKDHRSAGVTLALKNLSHGLNNNVARSHIPTVYRYTTMASAPEMTSGPNQCDTFIPTAAGQVPTRKKATLHIMDGLIGVYEGGPGSWNRTWATWPYKSLFFATDPIAMDMVGWDIIDRKRAEKGMRPVAEMGQLQSGEERLLESFDRRQPEHIILGGTIGLGKFESKDIYHSRIDLATESGKSIG